MMIEDLSIKKSNQIQLKYLHNNRGPAEIALALNFSNRNLGSCEIHNWDNTLSLT